MRNYQFAILVVLGIFSPLSEAIRIRGGLRCYNCTAQSTGLAEAYIGENDHCVPQNCNEDEICFKWLLRTMYQGQLKTIATMRCLHKDTCEYVKPKSVLVNMVTQELEGMHVKTSIVTCCDSRYCNRPLQPLDENWAARPID